LCRTLRLMLDQNSVVGQLDDSHIVVFWPDAPSELYVKTRLEDVIAAIQRLGSVSDTIRRVSLSAGLIALPANLASMEDLMSRAARACRQNSDTPSGHVCVFDPLSDVLQYAATAASSSSVSAGDAQNALSALTTEGKESLLACVLSLHSTGT